MEWAIFQLEGTQNMLKRSHIISDMGTPWDTEGIAEGKGCAKWTCCHHDQNLDKQGKWMGRWMDGWGRLFVPEPMLAS